MYDAIIFDFFDVIRTDAYQTWLNLHNYKKEGEFLTAVEKMDRGDINPPAFLQLLGDITGQSPTEIFAEMEAGTKIDYQVVELIEQLKPNYKIGLLSNSPSAFLRDILTTDDLEKHFDEIVISSEIGLIKPEPEIFEHMLQKINTPAHKAIFIDDNPKNVTGATQVGIEGILYTSPDALHASLRRLGVTF